MNLKPWLTFAGVAIAIGFAAFGVDYFRHRFVRSNSDLVKLLPPGDFTLFFADVSRLRKAGMLSLLTDVKQSTEKDYDDFVHATLFDYTRDLDGIAAASDGSQVFFVGRGRFDWGKIRTYAMAHGGVCQADYCSVPGTSPGRWANFFPLQADVIALAMSTRPDAADELRPPGPRRQEHIPAPAVWVNVSKTVLQNPGSLPLAARVFAISLQSAESVLLSLGKSDDGGVFDIQLDAGFVNEATADTARTQLDMQTKTLKLELARENQKPEQGNLTGLLTAGSFQVVNRRVIGTWPVHKELLSALQ